jgi:hypothetical protein
MAGFWLGAAAGGSVVAVATVWLCWWLHRRHTDTLELLAIRIEATSSTAAGQPSGTVSPARS